MLMNPNMGFGVFLLETLKTFLTMMIMEFRIMIHPEQQGRICCLCQQGGKNDQNLDVVLGEAVAVDGASVHSSDVVYAAFELRLRSLVGGNIWAFWHRVFPAMGIRYRKTGRFQFLVILIY
ncbi:hypothetical protein ACFX2K_001692 [Malus domestica]